MALSQIQCLDEHHVNWRVSESKPEFFYSEEQRLALEALISRGRDAFAEHLRERELRGFLSEPELERLARTAEAYRPGYEHQPQGGSGAPTTPGTPTTTPGTPTTTPGGNAAAADDGDGAVSLQYWPDRSEASVAELDMGWPEASSYRGVTRVTVHTQPPTEGTQTHIKEVVRKSIVNAQRVIAVVMDAFTDVDIFRDLLDASYKRKVPVYIILDTASVPCFLSMCGRADMHRGHLKNLRVRSCGGVEFCTRSAVKVRGSLSQRFLLVDGDKAISGSYSFTWSSSRLDRNLITVITGQAVETFDTQFRDLYLISRGVSLSKVSMKDEPVLDPVPQAAPAPVPANIARKFINPKYALVTTGNHASTTSSDRNSSNKNSKGLKFPKGRVKERMEAPPLHPGLADLEKAYLIPYLPTWPDPDPPKDVIGFINIRDDKRAFQVHLQRSERFEVSQAIRFRSPFAAEPTPCEKDTPEGAAHPTGTDTSENTGTEASAPLGQHNTQPTQQEHITHSSAVEHADETDFSRPSQQQSISQAEDTHKPDPHTNEPQDKDTSTSQPRDTANQTPETLPPDHPPAPPVPKPRTLQLVIDSSPSEQSGQPPQVTLIKKDQSDTTPAQTQEDKNVTRGLSLEETKDGGSVGEGSQDSTKVMCDRDRTANDNPSSEEEFYDCSQSDTSEPKASEPLANGVTTTGSGREHRAQGDGVNLMARLSQSLVDLRDPQPSEDSKALLLEARQLRQKSYRSPHRHIGQLFQASARSPGRDGQRGPKVVIPKPGTYRRHSHASVVGGHHYWKGQGLQPDAGLLPRDTRSGRSPRRHSPGNRRTGHASPQPPPAIQTGVLGVSFSKLSNLKHLKARAMGGGTQKKAPQTKKDAS